MSREIKFKVWDKKNKEMVKLYQLHLDNDQVDVINKDGLLYPILNKKDYVLLLLQYTGLKDKNKKEIFEGDIIKSSRYPTPLRVEWDYDQWGLFDRICNEASIDDIECEIIGNIYENKNLIK